MIKMNKSSDDAKKASSISSSFLSEDKRSYMVDEVEEEVCLSTSGNIDINLNKNNAIYPPDAIKPRRGRSYLYQ